MRIAYFDCFSGVSGDMALAALVHAGADLASITEVLASLPVGEFELEREEVEIHGIMATRIHVDAGPQDVIRTYASIRALLDHADLPPEPRRAAARIYRRLAGAAARVHGKDIELVTFHEFGDVDCLVDIIGCSLALHQLGVERIFSSPIPTGLGMARTEHGLMPVPGPVVLQLLQGAPTYSRGIPVELVSPTGAAILAALSEGYGEMPMMRAEQVGYGAGPLRLDFPHVLRVVVGEDQRRPALGAPTGWRPEATGSVLVEAAGQSADAEHYAELLERLIQEGASDAWVTPGIGRKGQARVTISAVGPAELTADLVRVLQSNPSLSPARVTSVALQSPRPEP